MPFMHVVVGILMFMQVVAAILKTMVSCLSCMLLLKFWQRWSLSCHARFYCNLGNDNLVPVMQVVAIFVTMRWSLACLVLTRQAKDHRIVLKSQVFVAILIMLVSCQSSKLLQSRKLWSLVCQASCCNSDNDGLFPVKQVVAILIMMVS